MTEQRVARVAMTGSCILLALLSCVSCRRHQSHEDAGEDGIPSPEVVRAEMTQRVFDPGLPPTGLPPRGEESIDQMLSRMAQKRYFEAVRCAGIRTAERLERTDRVDLFLLTDNLNPHHKASFPLPVLHAYAEVLDTRSVEQREDVRKIVQIWDEILRRKEHDLPCAWHDPTYGFRFFKGKEVLFETSIGSWNNFTLYVDGEPVWRVIPPNSSLWSYLSSIWPVPEFGSAVDRTNRVCRTDNARIDTLGRTVLDEPFCAYYTAYPFCLYMTDRGSPTNCQLIAKHMARIIRDDVGLSGSTPSFSSEAYYIVMCLTILNRRKSFDFLEGLPEKDQVFLLNYYLDLSQRGQMQKYSDFEQMHEQYLKRHPDLRQKVRLPAPRQDEGKESSKEPLGTKGADKSDKFGPDRK